MCGASILKRKAKRPARLRTFVEFTLLQLLQHNVQLGAAATFSLLCSHWFIYGTRQRFAIINLTQTVVHYRYFLNVIRVVVGLRRHILFVNDRKYSAALVGSIASSVGETYLSGRWIGGILTNFKQIWLMYRRLLHYRQGSFLSPSQLNMKNLLKGVAQLKALPSAVFFNSVRRGYRGLIEASSLHIPVAGITDTDALPEFVLYPIPGNDDSFGSILFLNQLLAKVILVSKMKSMVRVYTAFYEQIKR